MDVPAPRGPVTAQLWKSLITGSDIGGDISGWVGGSSDLADDDFQLALWMLYEAHHRGFDNGGVDDEWRLDHLRLRAVLEERFEGWLRAHTQDFVALVDEPTDDIADLLFEAVAGFDSPPLAAFLQRKASREQMRELLVQRNIYQLKEADPHSWAVPRLVEPAKVALVELLYDEYGSGRPERLHSHLFAALFASAASTRRTAATSMSCRPARWR